jgi:hypothetical protein
MLKVAHPTGFEPVTFAFGGRHSIQLSYGCLCVRCLRELFPRVKQIAEEVKSADIAETCPRWIGQINLDL